MLVSLCCNSKIKVIETPEYSYYECLHCQRPTVGKCVLNFNMELWHDGRNAAETEGVIDKE